MSSPAAIVVHDRLPESQRAALLKLLADEDRTVFLAVRKKILSLGPSAVEWLRPHVLSSDPVLRRHVHEIIRHFERQAADDSFLAFCLRHGDDFSLEEAAWSLARTQYPDINVEAYQALLDNYANDLQERIKPDDSARQTLADVNTYLFSELGFSGNEENYYDPDNSYLNRVLDRRTGNPINLCLVYLLLARRLRLPIIGIGLPGHFVCRFQSASQEIYIDVFNHGRLLTKADCIHHIQVNGGVGVMYEECLAPVTPRRMLTRICANLHQVYTRFAFREEARRFQRYLVALQRS